MNLNTLQFDPVLAILENNQSMLGKLSVRSDDGAALLEATLVSDEPDCSDDDRRAQCTLTVTVSTVVAGKFSPVFSATHDYVYHGDDKADHLQELLADGDLLEYLETPASA